jgi:hypothetical protein
MTPPSEHASGPRAVVVQHEPAARRTLQSVAHLDTKVLTLSPRFLEALEQVAPRRRRSRLPLALALAMATVLVIFAADPSMRAFIAGRGRQLLASLRAHTTNAAPSASTPVRPPLDPVLASPVVEAPVVVELPAPSIQAPVVAPPVAKAFVKASAKKTHSAPRTTAHGGRG